MPNGARNWCFTLNNPTPAERDVLAGISVSASPLISYLVVGREVGDSGTPHLQCYVQYDRQVSLARCRRLISDRAHYEVMRGAPIEASNYCKKDGDFDEYGEIGSAQGKRNDWDDLKEYVVDLGTVPSNRQLACKFPALFSRSTRLREICAAFLPPPKLVEGEPRFGFQANIWAMLQIPCTDTRGVYFYVDVEGNKGKSWMCAYLITNLPDRVQILSSGKRDDLAHVIDETKDIFVFDVPRGSMEFLQYAILEKLKDRMIFSPKYSSVVKVIQKLPHVLVMCNEEPDLSKMTQDRFKIRPVN